MVVRALDARFTPPLLSHIRTGYDGVKLWQLPGGRRVNAPLGGQGLRGPVSSLAWSKLKDSDILIFGTAGGYLCLWRRLKNVRKWCIHLWNLSLVLFPKV